MKNKNKNKNESKTIQIDSSNIRNSKGYTDLIQQYKYAEHKSAKYHYDDNHNSRSNSSHKKNSNENNVLNKLLQECGNKP